MEYFSNKEVVEKYNISQPTLFKWLKNAQIQKNNLVIQKVNKNWKIIKNEQNISELERLYLEAQKFKNKIALEKITPKSEFFEIFSHRQIVEIINDLQISKEINLKFSYFGQNNIVWDKQAKDTKNYKTTATDSQNLLNSFPFLAQKISQFSKINIIDIGCGNGLATLEFVKHIHKKKLLNKYIAVDISPEMLEIAKINLNAGIDNLNFVSYIHDIEESDIKEICFDNKIEKTVNLILFIGGTVGNFTNQDHIWSNLKNSLGKNDLLIISNKLDKNESKSRFDGVKKYYQRYLYIPNLLGLETINPKLHFIFNEKKQARCCYLELQKDYILNIKDDKIDTILKFQKGDKIEIWMHKLSTVQSLLDSLTFYGLEMVQLTTEKDGNHALVVAEKL